MSGDPRARYHEAIDALNRGDWARAQSLAMALLREVPPHAGVCFVAGVAAREQLQIPLAIELLEQAVRINPGRPDYFAQLARALAQASEPTRAHEAAERGAALPGADATTLDALGLAYTATHDYVRAAEMFRRAAEMLPDSARFQYNHATALIHAGDTDAAERALDACLRIDPTYWKAYLSRAQLRRHSPEDNHIAGLEHVREGLGDDAMAILCVDLALSRELEDCGRHEEAFERLVSGKRAWRRQSPAYTSASDEALFQALVDACPPPPADGGCDSDAPIFVIGLPRSGTTLVERVLSSHSQVHAAGELQNFSVALKRATGSRTPPVLDLDVVERSRGGLDWKALGEAYLASTRPGTAAAPRFVDKLPHNFLYAGCIAAALPRARIICLRRNPMDSVLGNFRQLFALGSPMYEYSFDLLDTARYYVLFDRMMRSWQERLPGRILEVSYENLVDDFEPGARRLVDFCGLHWEDACLRFEENPAPVATASATQVREPVNRRAIGRWRRYERELQPVRELLEAAGIAVDD
ncbi:sulfotransferase [Luteimonas sp. MJ246]|uniref:tetratricopeptide repeat-containing sulfotransferase family protein n=1 Tax=Luteimonas sp. MJ174 TaxID=3129237 RepID=UPI0031BA676D